MIEHVVLYRFKEGTPAETIDGIGKSLLALEGEIPEIGEIYYGENFSDRSRGHSHALVTRFASRADLEAYAGHPSHRRVVEEEILPHVDLVTVADVECP